MSYQALARKYRPRTFDQVIGQDHVVSALANALDSERIHHAFLFTGTRGVGKTTLARIFAKALNCEQGISSTPCGACVACNGVDQGNFVDLIEVDAASRTKVDDTRELLDNVQYTPTQGRVKIYLIDEVHMLSTHSFNALLKTLEEPPDHVKFLLATTDPQKLPATILSRCIQFNLKAMDIPRLVGQLGSILDQEDIPYEEPAVAVLSQSANGSVRDALSLLDQAIAYGNGKVETQAVRNMLGMIDDQYIEQLLGEIIAGDAASALATVAAMSERAVDYVSALDELLTLIHNLALFQVVPEAVTWKVADADALAVLAASADAEVLQLIYQIALTGKKDLPLAADSRSGFEMLILRLMAFQPDMELPDTAGGVTEKPRVQRVAKLVEENRLPTTSAATNPSAQNNLPETAPVAVAAEHDDSDEDTASQGVGKPPCMPSLDAVSSPAGWSEFVAHSSVSGMVREMMMQLVPTGPANGNVLELTIDPASAHLNQSGRVAKISRLLSEHLDSPVEVVINVGGSHELVGETPRQQANREAAERQSAAEEVFRNDANVKDLIELFDAEVVDHSIKPSNNAGSGH
ncbi:MAG: DNA polymerase III subunit gamma/tau [Pseudomonadota bacterium]